MKLVTVKMNCHVHVIRGDVKETVCDGAREVRWGVDSRGKVQRSEKSD